MLTSFFKKDEPVKIRFKFSQTRMTWDDLNTVEMMREGQASSVRLMNLAARFMVDERHEYLPTEKATKILGALTSEEIRDVMKQFTDAIQAAAINPPNGNGSSLPSDHGQAETLPAGQAPS